MKKTTHHDLQPSITELPADLLATIRGGLSLQYTVDPARASGGDDDDPNGGVIIIGRDGP